MKNRRLQKCCRKYSLVSNEREDLQGNRSGCQLTDVAGDAPARQLFRAIAYPEWVSRHRISVFNIAGAT
jgi:hypothetical protein